MKAAPLEARRELTPVRGVFCCRCQGLDYVREVARLEKLGVDMSKVGSSAIIGDAQGAGTREAFCSHHIPLGGAAQGNTSCGMPFGSMVRRHPVLLDFPRKIPILPPLPLTATPARWRWRWRHLLARERATAGCSQRVHRLLSRAPPFRGHPSQRPV